MRCRYCGQPIHKSIVGWMHIWPTAYMHIARPRRG